MGKNKILGSCNDCRLNNKKVNWTTDWVGGKKSLVKFCVECDACIKEKYKEGSGWTETLSRKHRVIAK